MNGAPISHAEPKSSPASASLRSAEPDGWLSLWQHSTAAWWGFVLIFAFAGSARILSALALSPVQDVHPTAHREAQQGFRGFFRQSATKDFRRFLLFSGLMHASVLIAGPFFVLYMLQDLHLSYLGYGGWLAAGLLGQLLTLQAWGQFGDRYGNKALLSITGFTVPILPMLYLVSTNLGLSSGSQFIRRRHLGRFGIGTAKLCVRFGQAGGPRESHRAVQHGQCRRMVGGSLAWELVSRAPSTTHRVGRSHPPACIQFAFCLLSLRRLAAAGLVQPSLAPSMKRAKWRAFLGNNSSGNCRS